MTEEQKKNLYKPEFRGHTCINQNSLGILRWYFFNRFQFHSPRDARQNGCARELTTSRRAFQMHGGCWVLSGVCQAQFCFIFVSFAFSSRLTLMCEILCRSEQILTLGPLRLKFIWQPRGSIVSSSFSILITRRPQKNSNTVLSLNLMIQRIKDSSDARAFFSDLS
jgi:hypothetical protein